MSQAKDELVARAQDPNAELETLHQLAQNYPGLRPYIAANPRTYPALLGLEQARKKAHDLIADARRSLDELAAQSLDTSALEALANYIIQRDK